MLLEDGAALLLPSLLGMESDDRLLVVSSREDDVKAGALSARVNLTTEAVTAMIGPRAHSTLRGATDGALVVRARPEALPFDEAQFTVVLAGHVVRSWDDATVLAFLREAWRVLRHNGVIVLWDVAPSQSQRVNAIWRRVLRSNNTRVIFENDSDQIFFIQAGLVNKIQCNLIESVGVDPDRFFPTPEPEGPVVILLASRMLWDKGVGVLADAAHLMKQKGLEFKIVLVGNPDPGNPTSISDEQLHAWEKENLLEWWGWQTDMQHVYSQCHIAVLPSFHEGVPTGLLEAAACGIPIVASDIPGCRTVVIDGETGLLVPPGQSESLAAALENLIVEGDLRGRMGKAGRERILKRFTQQKINQQTIEVYRLALSNQF
jgi:glycosyltransferase involved in cell wall biosynthesis